MPLILGTSLDLDRCPHCRAHTPHLERVHNFESNNSAGTNRRAWVVYVCRRCGGAVTAAANHDRLNAGHKGVDEYYPRLLEALGEGIPERPAEFLRQAQDSLHAPAGAVMLAASAVD